MISPGHVRGRQEQGLRGPALDDRPGEAEDPFAGGPAGRRCQLAGPGPERCHPYRALAVARWRSGPDVDGSASARSTPPSGARRSRTLPPSTDTTAGSGTRRRSRRPPSRRRSAPQDAGRRVGDRAYQPERLGRVETGGEVGGDRARTPVDAPVAADHDRAPVTAAPAARAAATSSLGRLGCEVDADRPSRRPRRAPSRSIASATGGPAVTATTSTPHARRSAAPTRVRPRSASEAPERARCRCGRLRSAGRPPAAGRPTSGTTAITRITAVTLRRKTTPWPPSG